MFTVALIGAGHRGINYTSTFVKKGYKVTAICDKDNQKIEKVKDKWQVTDANCFTSDKDFFSSGKLADALIIATGDRDHYNHAIWALEEGYNLLLEKPVSPSLKECREIEALAKQKNLRVMVCHVLRYAPYYQKIKSLCEEGVIGDIVSIKHSENISYWHYAHSYVRGNWHKEADTSPMIMAKCCHDLDLVYWFNGVKATKISSLGSLKFFNRSNAPKDAADRCSECVLSKTCIFDAEYQYIGRGLKKKKYPWGTYQFSLSNKKEELKKCLKTNNYGKCVYRCDNDVMDNQVAEIIFENGATCIFSVNAFNEDNYRTTHINGTKGEIIADDRNSVLTLRTWEGGTRKIIVNYIPLLRGHCGGDNGIVNAFINVMENNIQDNPQYSFISQTIESHRMALGAEKSRKEGGRMVDLAEIDEDN